MTDADAVELAGVSHIGRRASDVERSLRISTEGLGYIEAAGRNIPSALARLAEVDPPIACRSQMITEDGGRLELLGWREPNADGTARQTRRQISSTRLSIHAKDLEAIEAPLVALGATPIDCTRTHVPKPTGSMDAVFLADPDGIRTELVQVNP